MGLFPVEETDYVVIVGMEAGSKEFGLVLFDEEIGRVLNEGEVETFAVRWGDYSLALHK